MLKEIHIIFIYFFLDHANRIERDDFENSNDTVDNTDTNTNDNDDNSDNDSENVSGMANVNELDCGVDSARLNINAFGSLTEEEKQLSNLRSTQTNANNNDELSKSEDDDDDDDSIKTANSDVDSSFVEVPQTAPPATSLHRSSHEALLEFEAVITGNVDEERRRSLSFDKSFESEDSDSDSMHSAHSARSSTTLNAARRRDKRPKSRRRSLPNSPLATTQTLVTVKKSSLHRSSSDQAAAHAAHIRNNTPPPGVGDSPSSSSSRHAAPQGSAMERADALRRVRTRDRSESSPPAFLLARKFAFANVDALQAQNVSLAARKTSLDAPNK